ncbi:single-stranded-DNA-specific exonuclease RecJ [Polynucleobacter sphagniphilus]|jgi:single-stranded-DNA-specific exonuclease|uniref:Single-stranded-DNA-specific exonuclease RecJ n=1 Tax=Polynucleobacter sphagniphilus TaxID=1743169 RepID=A0AA43M8Y9_9BURK|nr:single-stranded-DNA-specific exonuclease RecJ [Polynucleobacter sphagniphilus]MDF9787391.1 single-stranded-DNA-specific exonuclease [Polynucleobacter sphagniphilus]MDH6248191.1 single-stranded-DNA-specific exonuclease [Polynucleobacter sphagniphilus]MDH6503264.1 single-stranded-DNA-specific exonuclease [Polynucleobacter sphagniphilus]MDH6511909.1 single-stranded-DNA-specific exonuclease [Polynucleobacter sphagniphilus]MDH6523934.1 single-stranded-DNA-specific exonuclease [Polynucleobacter s
MSQFSARPFSERTALWLQQSGLHPLLARLFAARGVDSPEDLPLDLKRLLSPTELKNCISTAALLADIFEKNEPILVVADYDCDGATACAVALRGLKMLGGPEIPVQFLVPNRFTMGYGLTPEVVELAAQQIPKPRYLITVDNGIASVAGVDRARELGMEVIVTDHHLPGDTLPKASALVNPNQPGCSFPSKALAGVGVIFYLLVALRAELRKRGKFTSENQPKIENLLDLVALGTVADVAQLDRNNRILVANGLKRIRAGISQAGMQALFQVANRDPRKANTFDLGFAVGPRLNAAGRLADMTLGIRLLLSDTQEEAYELAHELDRINRERRVIETGMQETALAHLQEDQIAGSIEGRNSICLWHSEWHQGVVGIVASRLKERFNRPAIVFAPADGATGEELRGSGRSITGFHLRDALDIVSKREPGLILKFGGHAMAAGLSIRQADFEKFDTLFQAVSKELLNDELLERKHIHDGTLSAADFTPEIGDLLAEEIWGQGFPQPIFYGEFEIGQQSLMKEKHLRLQLRPVGNGALDSKPLTGVWFNRTQTLPAKAKLAYRIATDRYQGQARVQLMIEAHDEDIA